MGRFVTTTARRWAITALAMLALAAQLAAVAAMPGRVPEGAARDGFFAASICHAGAGAPAGSGAPAHRDRGDCALCPFCRALAHVPVLPAPPALVPGAVAERTPPAAILPPARAPPSRPVAFAYPRGPPIPRSETPTDSAGASRRLENRVPDQ